MYETDKNVLDFMHFSYIYIIIISFCLIYPMIAKSLPSIYDKLKIDF